jgi:hypothetical protein
VSTSPSYLSTEQLHRDLGVRDLSDPAAGFHALQLLIDRAVERLSSSWGCEVRWCRGPRIVPIEDNYDHLLFAADSITRDARYTRYLDGQRMLRSHSTAMVPPALRRLGSTPADDVLLVCPGVVFRRDLIDWQHTGTPHQLDLWRITRRPLRQADMDEMVSLLLDALTAGRPYRQEPRVHPYTLKGRQVDVATDDRFVEVWECGVAHPAVLRRAGLEGCNGLALGMGLDRLFMAMATAPHDRGPPPQSSPTTRPWCTRNPVTVASRRRRPRRSAPWRTAAVINRPSTRAAAGLCTARRTGPSGGKASRASSAVTSVRVSGERPRASSARVANQSSSPGSTATMSRPHWAKPVSPAPSASRALTSSR